jgi:asparagine synthase (glutamine-hydrolysing)
VKVALGGDGGDELFAGYPKYRAERLLRLLGPLRGPGLAAAARLGSRRRTHRRLERAAATLAIRDEQLRWASWFRSFSAGEVEALVTPALRERARPEALLAPLAARLSRHAGLDPARRMLLADFETYLPDNMLIRVDRVLMAASLEGRVPLLDRDVVERVSRVPARERMGFRTGKTLFRRAVGDLLPPELLQAPKRGFPVPVASLLTSGGDGLAERLLLSERALGRGLLRPEAVTALVRGTGPPVVERELKLFTLLSLELWLRANVDRVTVAPPSSFAELLDEDVPAAVGL